MGNLGVALLILFPALALAQFESLATIYDGSRLYFATNLRQAGTNQPLWGKLFIADDAGIRPLAIRFAEGISDVHGYLTNDYHLTSVSVAHNASRLALVGSPNCTYGSPCWYNEQSHTDTYDWRGVNLGRIPGRGILSPNGRWALVSKVSAVPVTATSVVDLDSGLTTDIPLPINSSNYRWQSHALADDGTAVLVEPGVGAVLLVRPGASPERIDTNADSAAMDASGATAVWAEYVTSPGPRRLRVLDTRTVSHRVLYEQGDSYAPRVSDDGSRVLFISTASSDTTPQVFVMRPDGSGVRQVTREASGVEAAALSGNGMVAWVLTGDGSLLKFGIDNEERRQFAGPSIRLGETSPIGGFAWLNGAPGMVLRIRGTHLTSEAQVQVAGVAAPVLAADASSLTLQIPWEVSLDPGAEVRVSVAGFQDPVWVAGIPLRLAATFAGFALDTYGYPVAVHADWGSLITRERPAVPGEVIHLYATGLGTVSPAVPAGEPAPVAPLSRLAQPIQCDLPSLHVESGVAEVLFAGLAPGTIGYYQLDLRLPAVLPPPSTPGITTLAIVCHSLPGSQEPVGWSGSVPVRR